MQNLQTRQPGTFASAVVDDPVSLIRILHRNPDGFVAFAVKDDERFCPKVAIRAGELATAFPAHAALLSKNSYVSINAAYRCRPGKASWPDHRVATLRYICACYADIDYRNFGMDFGTACRKVERLVRDGTIPEPSIIVRSGPGGMWLLWLIASERDRQLPETAFAEKIDLHGGIERAIVTRLVGVGADPVATDLARYIRIPGSFRTDTEELVEWSVQNENGSTPTYTLKSLATSSM